MRCWNFWGSDFTSFEVKWVLWFNLLWCNSCPIKKWFSVSDYVAVSKYEYKINWTNSPIIERKATQKHHDNHQSVFSRITCKNSFKIIQLISQNSWSFGKNFCNSKWMEKSAYNPLPVCVFDLTFKTTLQTGSLSLAQPTLHSPFPMKTFWFKQVICVKNQDVRIWTLRLPTFLNKWIFIGCLTFNRRF